MKKTVIEANNMAAAWQEIAKLPATEELEMIILPNIKKVPSYGNILDAHSRGGIDAEHNAMNYVKDRRKHKTAKWQDINVASPRLPSEYIADKYKGFKSWFKNIFKNIGRYIDKPYIALQEAKARKSNKFLYMDITDEELKENELD